METACKECLQRLRIEYLDLFLVIIQGVWFSYPSFARNDMMKMDETGGCSFIEVFYHLLQVHCPFGVKSGQLFPTPSTVLGYSPDKMAKTWEVIKLLLINAIHSWFSIK